MYYILAWKFEIRHVQFYHLNNSIQRRIVIMRVYRLTCFAYLFQYFTLDRMHLLFRNSIKTHSHIHTHTHINNVTMWLDYARKFIFIYIIIFVLPLSLITSKKKPHRNSICTQTHTREYTSSHRHLSVHMWKLGWTAQ